MKTTHTLVTARNEYDSHVFTVGLVQNWHTWGHRYPRVNEIRDFGAYKASFLAAKVLIVQPTERETGPSKKALKKEYHQRAEIVG